MNTVFGLLKTQDALDLGVLFQHCQGEETESSIRQGSSRMSSLVCSRHVNSQQLPLLIAIDRDCSDVLNQIGQTVCNSTQTLVFSAFLTVSPF